MMELRVKIYAATAVGVVCLLIVLSAVFGYLGGKSKAEGSNTSGSGPGGFCKVSPETLDGPANRYYQSWYPKYSNDVCVPDASECNTIGLPRHYIAHHLNGKTIVVDGHGNDQAWTEVPWSETYIDARGENYPKPRFDTKFKVRWDDRKLYALIYVQETDLYATATQHDGDLVNDNEVEILINVDGSMWYYKQFMVTALGTFSDHMWSLSPWDVTNGTSLIDWHSDAQVAVYTTGSINDPVDKDGFWTVEISVPFETLAQHSSSATTAPSVDDTWFMQFGRGEFIFNVVNNKYVKTTEYTSEWWSWQSCGAINFHLLDRWGLVQFKKDQSDNQFLFNNWHIYKALFDVFKGMKKYRALNGKHTDSIYDLEIPVSLLSGVCVQVPSITLPQGDLEPAFQVDVVSNLASSSGTAHIRQDRYVWFD